MTIQVPSLFTPVTVQTKGGGGDAQVPTTSNPVTVLAENDLAPLQRQIDALAARVAALEEGEEPPSTEPPPDGPPDTGEPPPDGGSPPEPTAMGCVISYDGHEYAYDPAAGTDLGDYADPRFIMTCVRVTHQYCPIRVDFRSIPGTTWWCAIFDYGDAWGAGGAKNLAGPIQVDIGGQTITLASHPWGSRWRWQAVPWPFDLVTPEAMMDAGQLLRFDRDIPQGTAPTGMTASYVPLGFASCGLTPSMPMTGGRQDIGYVTDLTAQWICGATDAGSVLAQGEAAASVPWRLYDPDTGRTVDFMLEYPKICLEAGNVILQVGTYVPIRFTGPPGAPLPGYVTLRLADGSAQDASFFGSGSLDAAGTGTADYWENGWNARDPTGATVEGLPQGWAATILPGTVLSSGIYPESAHMPSLSYVPWLMTGDPYHLENLHSQVAFAFIEYNRDYPNAYIPGLGQVRGGAWNLRAIAQAASATPDSVPPWLLSKQVMQAAFDQCVVGMQALIDNPPRAEVQTVFHHVSPNTNGETNFWMHDYFCEVSAAAAQLHASWLPHLRWVLENSIARLDGRSGWGRGNPDPYTVWLDKAGGQPPFCTSWREAATRNGLTVPDLNPDAPPQGEMDYINGLHAALAAATQVLDGGDMLYREAVDCLEYLDSYHSQWLTKGQIMEFKYAIKAE